MRHTLAALGLFAQVSIHASSASNYRNSPVRAFTKVTQELFSHHCHGQASFFTSNTLNASALGGFFSKNAAHVFNQYQLKGFITYDQRQLMRLDNIGLKALFKGRLVSLGIFATANNSSALGFSINLAKGRSSGEQWFAKKYMLENKRIELHKENLFKTTDLVDMEELGTIATVNDIVVKSENDLSFYVTKSTQNNEPVIDAHINHIERELKHILLRATRVLSLKQNIYEFGKKISDAVATEFLKYSSLKDDFKNFVFQNVENTFKYLKLRHDIDEGNNCILTGKIEITNGLEMFCKRFIMFLEDIPSELSDLEIDEKLKEYYQLDNEIKKNTYDHMSLDEQECIREFQNLVIQSKNLNHTTKAIIIDVQKKLSQLQDYVKSATEHLEDIEHAMQFKLIKNPKISKEFVLSSEFKKISEKTYQQLKDNYNFQIKSINKCIEELNRVVPKVQNIIANDAISTIYQNIVRADIDSMSRSVSEIEEERLAKESEFIRH